MGAADLTKVHGLSFILSSVMASFLSRLSPKCDEMAVSISSLHGLRHSHGESIPLIQYWQCSECTHLNQPLWTRAV